jgi:hypothetical protein
MIGAIILSVICFGIIFYWLTHRDQDCDNESGWHNYGQWEWTEDKAPPGKFTHRPTQVRHCTVCNKAQYNHL